ncbi:MAG: hypothetical protein NC311_04250 [Muribaculaceae bacterium]|nr:hypothetical protein [Muribaculaceae bacterium]
MINTEQKIQSIIDKMHEIFRASVGANNRAKYMRENSIPDNIDWSFSLSADDIIQNKIPPRVAGCTGRAKVFCKLATDVCLPCYVVTTANYADWMRARAGYPNIINGHQIIAVEIDGALRAFGPGREKLEWIPGTVAPGHFINAIRNRPAYLITAIVPRDEFGGCNTYQKLRNLYTSGTIENSGFMIKPYI